MAERDAKDMALITGASAGIGAELAREFARNGHSLVLVARRGDKLRALAAELTERHGILAEVVAADLLEPDAHAELVAEVERRGLPVAILVNNAGVLESGGFHQMEEGRVEGLIALNVRALTLLSHAFIRRFVAAGRGRVLNVASIGAFQPVPSLAVYAATKAYVLSFTEALSEELRGTGVSATALCPGMTDTGMMDHAMAGTGGKLNVPHAMMSDPADVARAGYRALMAGRAVEVPGVGNQLLTGLVQLQPRWLVRAVGGFAGRRLER